MIIRPATADDAYTVAGIKMESWRHSYRGIVPDAVLAAMTAEDVCERWLGVEKSAFPTSTLVIGNGENLDGYVMFGSIRGASYGYSGQLYEIYLRPSCMGRGSGTALFSAASQRLCSLGHERFLLWVFAANTLARRFYERLGGRLVQGASVTTIIGGARLAEVAYGNGPLPVTSSNR